MLIQHVIVTYEVKQPINSTSFPKKGAPSPEVMIESEAAPLIDAKCAQQDVVAVMTALHSFKGLTFATACEVLIYEFSELHPDWATLAKTACVLPVSSMPAERGFTLHNQIKMALKSCLQEERVTRLTDTFDFKSAA